MREPARLAREQYDLAIVGGGIYGACVAREAALAGLKVALVERGDFGHATSWNSLRTLHGGIRYLQHLDIVRLRHAVRDRRFWMQLAPELTRPLPFVLPTRGWGVHGPGMMAAGCALFDMLAIDRNSGLEPSHRLGRSRVVGRATAERLLQPARPVATNGAIVWHEAVAESTERLLLRVLQDGVARGAVVQNYCEVVGREQREDLHVLRVIDCLTGEEWQLHARSVLNAAGPAVDDVSEALQIPRSEAMMYPSRAFNLVLRKSLDIRHAVGIPVRRATSDPDARIDRGENTYFLIPWSGRTLVGTKHLPAAAAPFDPAITRAEMLGFIRELNEAVATEIVRPEDVLAVLSGIVPAAEPSTRAANAGSEVRLLKTHRIIDHGLQDGIPRVLTVVGVKWTAAPSVAAEVVSAVSRSLSPVRSGLPQASCTSSRMSLGPPGGQHAIDPTESRGSGSTWPESAGERIVADQPATEADIIRAVRNEAAVRLEDVVLRRTTLWLSTCLDIGALERCARAMARELAWSDGTVRSNVVSTAARLASIRSPDIASAT